MAEQTMPLPVSIAILFSPGLDRDLRSFWLCTLLCATEFVEFPPDFWCTTMQKCPRIVNSCHPPPEKKRRVWEVLRLSLIHISEPTRPY